jgi:hypothetical protein
LGGSGLDGIRRCVKGEVQGNARHFFLLISQIILMALFVLFVVSVHNRGFLVSPLHICMNVLVFSSPRSASACLS